MFYTLNQMQLFITEEMNDMNQFSDIETNDKLSE